MFNVGRSPLNCNRLAVFLKQPWNPPVAICRPCASMYYIPCKKLSLRNPQGAIFDQRAMAVRSLNSEPPPPNWPTKMCSPSSRTLAN